MKTNARQLRSLVEALWRAEAPARFGFAPIEVEADRTKEAGELASDRWMRETEKYVDPYSVSLVPVKDDPASTQPSGVSVDSLPLSEVAEMLSMGFAQAIAQVDPSAVHVNHTRKRLRNGDLYEFRSIAYPVGDPTTVKVFDAMIDVISGIFGPASERDYDHARWGTNAELAWYTVAAIHILTNAIGQNFLLAEVERFNS